MRVVLDEQKTQQLLNYLGTRPYVDVAQLIELVVTSQEPEEADEEKE